MKKIVALVIGLLVLLGLLTAGAYYWANQQFEQQASQLVQLETDKVATSFANVKADQVRQGLYLVAPDGQTSDIGQDLAYWLDQYGQSNLELQGEDKLLIGRVQAAETDLADVRKLTLSVTVYQKNLWTYDKLREQTLRTYHILPTEASFTLADLLGNSQQRFEEELAKVNPVHASSWSDPLPQFQQTGLATDQVDYQNGFIIWQGQDKVALSSLFDVINPAYLKGKNLEDYQAYQTELARKAEEERLRKEAEDRLEAERQDQLARQAQPGQALTGKVVALTFDDGPAAGRTNQVLDILDRYGIKGTFYVIGRQIAGNEGILQRMAASGHEIGNHTWDHSNLTKLTSDQIRDQVSATNAEISRATGLLPKTIRPPYGATNASVRGAAGLTEVLWSVDTRDWESHNPAAILANVKAQTRAGSVVLMHDIHQTSIAALPGVIDYLIGQGYQFVTVSQLYGL